MYVKPLEILPGLYLSPKTEFVPKGLPYIFDGTKVKSYEIEKRPLLEVVDMQTGQDVTLRAETMFAASGNAYIRALTVETEKTKEKWARDWVYEIMIFSPSDFPGGNLVVYLKENMVLGLLEAEEARQMFLHGQLDDMLIGCMELSWGFMREETAKRFGFEETR